MDPYDFFVKKFDGSLLYTNYIKKSITFHSNVFFDIVNNSLFAEQNRRQQIHGIRITQDTK